MLRSIGILLLFSLGALSLRAPPASAQGPAATNAPQPSAVPPPSAPPKRSAADLDKLVAPIALYSDPLIATILPASVYPLEIVQAARFIKDTNNLANLDAQPWDENVKAVARLPAAIEKMNQDLQWTINLGEAFLAQEKDVMDAIQRLRAKAEKAGTLQTTPQQVVVVTNEVVQKTVEQQVVVVTNTIVQIQPANPQVVYVPTYDPWVVYAPPPAYVYNPVAPLVTFGVGVAVGAVIANNCDWHGGGVYVGHHGVAVWGGGSHHSDVDVNVNRNVNVNNTRSTRTATSTGQQKWQPDPNRVRTSGASGTSASAGSAEARGWGSGTSQRSAPTSQARSSAPSASARASSGSSAAPRPTGSSGSGRPAPSGNAGAARSSASGSAFSGMSSGSSARSSSSRGAASRGGGFGGGGRGGGRR